MTSGDDTERATRPLLDWLRRKYPDTPRARAKQWILAGRVSANGVVLRRPHHLLPDPGDRLKLLARHSAALECGAGWQIHPRLALLHLDAALAIVNKGPGLLAVPANNASLSALSILADFLAGRLKPREGRLARKSLPPAYRALQPLPVHRLDQYTSGVFCMALNPAARRHLIAQVQAHTMTREYVAFVEGRPPAPAGTWRHWVRLGAHGLRQHIVSPRFAKRAGSGAEEAITHYEVLAEYPLAGGSRSSAKLRLRLETGRKHQIRLQAASAGLPLIGDRTYNPNYRANVRTAALLDFPRQALHSEVLTLEHPERPGARITWRAELPQDLRQLEAALRSCR